MLSKIKILARLAAAGRARGLVARQGDIIWSLQVEMHLNLGGLLEIILKCLFEPISLAILQNRSNIKYGHLAILKLTPAISKTCVVIQNNNADS